MSSSTTNTLGFRRPTSAPAYFTLAYSVLITAVQGLALYDPTSTQEMLGITDPATVRMIAFCLICIKGYEFIGALQDNWAIYYFALVGRTLAASLMMASGGGWAKIAPIDFASATVLGMCMALTPSNGGKQKMR